MGRKKKGSVLFAKRVSPEESKLLEDYLGSLRLGSLGHAASTKLPKIPGSGNGDVGPAFRGSDPIREKIAEQLAKPSTASLFLEPLKPRAFAANPGHSIEEPYLDPQAVERKALKRKERPALVQAFGFCGD